MDILQEIKKEHQEFKSLISKVETAVGKKKKELFEELSANITGHHESEEHVLFPDVKKKADDHGKEIIMEMVEEHSLLAYQLSVIQKTAIDNETWDAKFGVFKEVLTHHIEEEEAALFAYATKTLSKEVLKEKYNEFEEIMEKFKEERVKKLAAQ